LRGRFAAPSHSSKDDSNADNPSQSLENNQSKRNRSGGSNSSHGEGDSDACNDKVLSIGVGGKVSGTMLDGDFLEFTAGRPMPMNDRAKAVFHMSILNVSAYVIHS